MCEVCKRWRDVARLAWSTRQSISINYKNKTQPTGDEDFDRGIYFTLSHEHVLTDLIATKHIGHALTRLELHGVHHSSMDSSEISISDDEGLSLTALAQHCPNLEYLDLRQVTFLYFLHK